MWLDGLYMAQPFYAEYAMLFGEDTAFNDIARQFILIDRHTRDAKTGLYYHGWDESMQQAWADKVTGLSPHVWGRALGWFGMAMVDALEYFPPMHPRKDSIVSILNRFAEAVTSIQDPESGLWLDVPSVPGNPKNYFEASASSMLVYTLAKGARLGYLKPSYAAFATKGFNGILQKFIAHEGGSWHLNGTVAVSGLGGKPYRDGSFEYYMSEPVITDDPKGLGAFINAANEMELAGTAAGKKSKTIFLDGWFNNEWKKGPGNREIRHHYTWNDRSNGGFYFFGKAFERQGAVLNSLDAAPDEKSLDAASVYIIVDPDTEKESAFPRYMSEPIAEVISRWVEKGGVLVLMANDRGNAELEKFNLLAKRFGIRFNTDVFNTVEGSQFEQGAVMVPDQHPFFKQSKKLYIKELSTLELNEPAKAVMTKDGKGIMAMARFGKGMVFAVGDPWLYNEYVDGRKLPPGFDNFKAMNELVTWLLQQ
jgi:unsaturated rhamnogalacturonyl hydrolase